MFISESVVVPRNRLRPTPPFPPIEKAIGYPSKFLSERLRNSRQKSSMRAPISRIT